MARFHKVTFLSLFFFLTECVQTQYPVFYPLCVCVYVCLWYQMDRRPAEGHRLGRILGSAALSLSLFLCLVPPLLRARFSCCCRGTHTPLSLILFFFLVKMRTEGKIEGTMISKQVRMKDFLANKGEDSQNNRYIVGELPRPMHTDAVVPSCFSCGPFSSHITEVKEPPPQPCDGTIPPLPSVTSTITVPPPSQVDIWISNGATRSKS